MVIRCLLQIDDRDVTSHSLKTTCLSWAAKAELPREQRRLLGRHSSSLQDSDSIYARDLAVAPVKALQRVLTLIRDDEFETDQPRADFFKGANPLAPGTPAPVFQPGTPAFLSKEMGVEHCAAAGPEYEWEHITPKKESECIEVDSAIQASEIEVLSSSDSSSSTSGCEDVDSDVEHEVEVSHDRRPPDEDEFSLDAMVKNGRTGIIHRVPDIGPDISGSIYANGELLQKKTTKCGRLTSAGFIVVQTVPDWTAKCRVCFKGCREPPKRR